jgi:hypothetical protein
MKNGALNNLISVQLCPIKWADVLVNMQLTGTSIPEFPLLFNALSLNTKAFIMEFR